MSLYEWECGEITIPTAEKAALHKKLRDWTNRHHDLVRTQAIHLHNEIGNGTRSVKLYQEQLQAAEDKAANEASLQQSRSRGPSEATKAQRLAKAAAMEVLSDMVSMAVRKGQGIHQPTVKEIEAFAPRATNRTTDFHVIGDGGDSIATITFNGNIVTWHVPENNHAVDNAHNAPLGKIFFGALDKMSWTRNSGGFGTCTSEINQADDNFGGGDIRLSFTFGPRGEEARANQMGLTVAQYKTMTAARPQRQGANLAGRW